MGNSRHARQKQLSNGKCTRRRNRSLNLKIFVRFRLSVLGPLRPCHPKPRVYDGTASLPRKSRKGGLSLFFQVREPGRRQWRRIAFRKVKKQSQFSIMPLKRNSRATLEVSTMAPPDSGSIAVLAEKPSVARDIARGGAEHARRRLPTRQRLRRHLGHRPPRSPRPAAR